MNGMDIEVIGNTYYTVHLTEEEVEKIRQYIETHKDNLSSFEAEDNICEAAMALYIRGDINFFDDGKYEESDYSTEEVKWSDCEERSAEEILAGGIE